MFLDGSSIVAIGKVDPDFQQSFQDTSSIPSLPHIQCNLPLLNKDSIDPHSLVQGRRPTIERCKRFLSGIRRDNKSFIIAAEFFNIVLVKTREGIFSHLSL